MDMLEKHSLARKKSNVVVHNIKTEYKKGERWKVFYDNSTYGMAAVLVSNSVNKERLAKYVKIKKMIKIESENVWVECVKGKPIKEYLYENLN